MNLDKLASNTKNLNGKNRVSSEELFSTSFMKKHSKYDNITLFLKMVILILKI